jgi:Cft2 family RNA processing exonuclease
MRSQVGDEIDLQDDRPRVERRCQVDRFYFSAHSTRKELLGLLTRMQPRRTVLVHGDPNSSLALSDLHKEEKAAADTLLPQPGVPYDL